MAQTARNEAEKATNATADHVAELSRQTANKGVELARETVEKTADTARRGFQAVQQTAGAVAEVERAVARRSVEASGELSQVFADLWGEQTRASAEAFRALTGTVDWDAAARIQGDFLRVSMERSAEFTRRYCEAVQAVISSAASATKDQICKAA